MAPGQQRAAAHWYCIIQTLSGIFVKSKKKNNNNLQIFQKKNEYTEWKLYAIVTIEML